jgi:hypothetical protein
MFGSARKLFKKIGLQDNSGALSSSMELPLTHEFRGRASFACLIPLLLIAHSAWALNPHPRIWLSPQMLSDLSAKVAAHDPDWIAAKAIADASVSWPLPIMTITGATNANPVQFTIVETVPMASGGSLFIGGGTGNWSAINAVTGAGWTVTVTGTHTFTIPVDATTFGSFSGQLLATFQKNGCLNFHVCFDYSGLGWVATVPYWALAYKMTGTTAYANQVRAWLDYVNAASAVGIYAPESIDTGFPSRSAAMSLAIAYDWCYDRLSPQQKTASAVTANLWFTYVNTPGSGVYGVTGGVPQGAGAFSNYTGGHIFGMGLMGYATYGDNSNAQTMIDWASNTWNTYMAVAFAAPVAATISWNDPTGIYAAGVPSEYNYGPNHLTRLLEYIWATKTATGSEPTQVADYKTLWANALIYDLQPDNWSVRRDGVWSGNVTGVMSGNEPLLLSYLMSGSTTGAWMQWMFTHFGTPPSELSEFAPTMLADSAGPSSGTGLGSIERLLFYRSAATATDYRSTLPAYTFTNDASPHIYWRSDWTSSAVWLIFHAAQEFNIASDTAGELNITRGTDQLIVNSQNWKGTSGTIGTPGIFVTNSALASTLYFSDNGEYFPTGPSYYGGQGVWGKYVAPSYKLAADHAYASVDVTNSYDYNYNPTQRSLRYFYRSVVAMGDGTFVVWDQIKALKSSYVKHLRWHLSSLGTPSKNGNIVSNIVASSAVFIDSVLPASPNVSIVRNKDVDGFSGAGNTNWHVEVSDSAGGTDLNALTVLYATASNGSLPATTALGTIDANHVGVQIADTTPKVVIFAAPVTDKGNGAYAPNTYNSVAFTTTHAGTGNYLISGLTPGTYSVLQNGASIPGNTSTAVGADGTLFFKATAGAFSVALQSPATVSPCDLNGDSFVNILDVQIAVNISRGIIPCPPARVSTSGACTITPPSIVAAALGGACSIQ